MARLPTLTYHRGTLLIHPPPRGKSWIDYAVWDDRVEKFRIRAYHYRPLTSLLQSENIEFIDQAKNYQELTLIPRIKIPPYPHQEEALEAWEKAGGQGVVILPTASGKTYLAQLAIQGISLSTLIVVPTLDLMHQWYAHLKAAFPDVDLGLLGGGSRDKTSILVATYDSATIHTEFLGNQYGLLVFDECHHLPTDFYRVIAEDSIAPYRLGLSATPERTDGRHMDLDILIGSPVFRKRPEDLMGSALAEHKTIKILVKLSEEEHQNYRQLIQTRNDFLQKNNIKLGGLDGWKQFVIFSARSAEGRRAMLAHRQAKEISLCTAGKLRVLADILAENYPQKTLIFTADNSTVYRISQEFLIPCITHQTPVKERHDILTGFRQGEYKTLVASHVLNEGVDVPDAKIAIILSGTGSEREYIQRLGRVLRKGTEENKLAILYEVVTENTSEELTSLRRQGKLKSPLSPVVKNPVSHPLKVIPSTPIYGSHQPSVKRAAESSHQWGKNDVKSTDDSSPIIPD